MAETGIRLYFQKHEREQTGRPHTRYKSVWISPDRKELPVAPRNAPFRIEEAEPEDGFDRCLRIQTPRGELAFRRDENGHWEVAAGLDNTIHSNGNKLATMTWHPFSDNLISVDRIAGSRGPPTYALHAALDSEPVDKNPPYAFANRLMDLGLEPKLYKALVVVPGCKVQVETDSEGRVKRNPNNGKTRLYPSEMMKLRVREGLRQLLWLHHQGVPAALAFSGGKLHYYERQPVSGMEPQDLDGKTEASVMQEYMAKLLSSDEEFKTWVEESPESIRRHLPKTKGELLEWLGGNARHMTYADTFSQDALGNMLGVRREVVEPRQGRDYRRRKFPGIQGVSTLEDVHAKGDEFHDLDQVHLIIEDPFKNRFLHHLRSEFEGLTAEAHVPPVNEKVEDTLMKRYEDEHLKVMREQGQEYIRENEGKDTDQRVAWLAENHPFYRDLLKPRPRPKPREPGLKRLGKWAAATLEKLKKKRRPPN